MAPAKKIDLKDKVEDGEIDLSMLSLEDVPVKEIASVKKAYSLDLSNNHLERLPNNFATLINLTKIDLSKNNLKELPDNFGSLQKLIHLDLYKNQLQHLPLSFCGLKNLKWLDLKDNPLVPAIGKVAGPCLDNKQCQLCAKNIIQFYSEMNEKVEQMKVDQEAQRVKNLAYKAKQEKKKKEKKQRQKDKNDNLAKENTKKEEPETVPEDIIHKEQETAIVVTKRSSSVCQVFRTIFLILFFSFLGLFLATAFKVKYLRGTEQHIVSLWLTLREYFPNYWENYVIMFEKKFANYHSLIGDYLIRMYENLSNSPYILLIQDYIFYTVQNISKKINEVFHNIL